LAKNLGTLLPTLYLFLSKDILCFIFGVLLFNMEFDATDEESFWVKIRMKSHVSLHERR